MGKMDKKRILIVDDQKDIVELIRYKLENEGLECLVASDGEEGLQKAKKEDPDLILMDIMMPKINGYQVCRLLKSDENYKHIPIIMLSAKDQESDKFWGKESGADDYVTKPFNVEKLFQKIQGYLEA
jgi:DNA-binding response OmpR family regulator